jgi:hypothetical protein
MSQAEAGKIRNSYEYLLIQFHLPVKKAKPFIIDHFFEWKDGASNAGMMWMFFSTAFHWSSASILIDRFSILYHKSLDCR